MREPPIEIEVARRFEAPPARLFDAWLDPASARHWLFATPGGVMEKVEIDPRPGGHFRIDERRGEQLAEHVGEFLAIDRPHGLVFRFAALPSVGMTRVTIEIRPEDNGSHLTLVHELDAEWAAYAERTREGWASILEGLARTL